MPFALLVGFGTLANNSRTFVCSLPAQQPAVEGAREALPAAAACSQARVAGRELWLFRGIGQFERDSTGIECSAVHVAVVCSSGVWGEANTI